MFFTAAKTIDHIVKATYLNCQIKYCIASNYGPGVYFFPAILNQATKQDRWLLSEETCAVYNLWC